MDGWSVALLIASGFVAVSGLVRLMLARRNRLLIELRQKAASEQSRKKPSGAPARTAQTGK